MITWSLITDPALIRLLVTTSPATCSRILTISSGFVKTTWLAPAYHRAKTLITWLAPAYSRTQTLITWLVPAYQRTQTPLSWSRSQAAVVSKNYKWQLVNRICRLEKTKHSDYIAQKCFQDSRKGEIWVQGDEYVQWTHKECAAYMTVEVGSPATSAMTISR